MVCGEGVPPHVTLLLATRLDSQGLIFTYQPRKDRGPSWDAGFINGVGDFQIYGPAVEKCWFAECYVGCDFILSLYLGEY